MTPDEMDEHDRNVDAALGELDGAAARADVALRDAERALRALMSGDAWWVELAEGVDGSDAKHCIHTAQRAVRNLQRAVARSTPSTAVEGKDTTP